MRIRNIGNKVYENGKFLHLYWSLGSTVSRIATWLGLESYEGQTMGGIIGTAIIPKIEKGESAIIKIPWSIQDSDSSLIRNDNFSILAFISKNESAESSLSVFEDQLLDIKRDNNIALKSISTIKNSISQQYKEVYVRNYHRNIGVYDIALNPTTLSQTTTDHVIATMFLSENLYNAWKAGGAKGQGITDKSNDGKYIIEIDNGYGCLQNIVLRNYEIGKIKIGFTSNYFSSKMHLYNLKQSLSGNNIIGGELLIKPATQAIKDLIYTTPNSASTITLAVKQSTESTTWFDESGNIIGTGNSVEVQPTPNNRRYSVRISSEEGEDVTSSIELQPTVGIKNVGCTHSNTTLTVDLYRGCLTSLGSLFFRSIRLKNKAFMLKFSAKAFVMS